MSKGASLSRIGYIKRLQRDRAVNSPGTDSAASRITLVVTPHPALLSMLKINASITTRARILLGSLAAINGLAWLLIWSVPGRREHAVLIAAGLAAYLFGLRHAVDADHIAAIDNTTRRLMRQNKRPIGVGLFFSLGHSTVVVLLCVALALSTAYVQRHLPQWRDAGSMIGTLISALFLYLIGAINLYALWELVQSYRKSRGGGSDASGADDSSDPLLGGGLIARLLRPLLRMIDHSWQMYFVGFLFGLGFDTASEVGILALSAKSGQSGLPFWTIMLLPLLFTAGMCLIDTLDGILMLGAYGWAFVQPRRKLLYNASVTLLSIATALIVGTVELMQVSADKTWLRGAVAHLAESVNLDNAGFWIIGLFAACWGISVLLNRRVARG